MSAVNPLSAPFLPMTLSQTPITPRTVMTNDGNALFEDTHYGILVTDRGQIDVLNKSTGETYQIWSGMHFRPGDNEVFNFWGHTTFVFESGTKAIIETVPWEAHPEMTIASVVSIISGNYGVQVRGVEPVVEGDLSFRKSFGPLLDAFVPDGNTIYENPNGPGFVTVGADGQLHEVDQASLSESDLRNIEKLSPELMKFLRLFGGLLTITLAGNFVSSVSIDTDFDEGSAPDIDRINLSLVHLPPNF